MKILCALSVVFFALAATAANGPYNEKADAKSDIQQALKEATAAKTPVIVVFGANWCGDCKMLEYSMEKGASAALMAQDFKIVKVNVGRFDKNVEVAKSYGVPLAKGIPAVAILSTNNQVIYVTKDGELANARSMGDKGIYEFFKKVTAPSSGKN
jgi:thioredoxin 1